MVHKNQVIPLLIESISSDGNGVGHHEGFAVFVPGAAKGDVLRVRIVKRTKSYSYGRIEQIVTPGRGRQKPDCPISSICGGCDFRHITYKAELEAKKNFVQSAIQRIGGLDVDVPPVLPSPSLHRYRNKAQYPVAPDKNKGLSYGFYANRSHRIIPCEDCLLQPEFMNQIASRIVELFIQMGISGYDEITQSGLIRHIYMRQSVRLGEVLLCIVATSENLPNKQELISTLIGEFPDIKSIVLNVNQRSTNVILGQKNCVLYGNSTIKDDLCGVPLLLGPFSFSQVNTYGAERLFGLAKEYASLQKGETLLDLYCGTGVIGLSMAEDAGRLIGVEITPEAVEGARRSAAEMGLSNTLFMCEDAGTASSRLAAEGIHPDVIIVDPPRKGCDSATIKAVLSMNPSRIVMISCNAATMARDLAVLVDGGYHVQNLQPVDLFPRTKHVESVVLMLRNS